MKTILISLEIDNHRRNYTMDHLKKYNLFDIYWLKGVNGATDVKYYDITDSNGKTPVQKLIYNNKSRLYRTTIRRNQQLMSKGEIGCALSHLNVYEMLLKDSDNDRYLVFEDDGYISVSIEEFKDFMNNLPNSDSYDICHLYKSEWYPFLKDKNVNSHFCLLKKDTIQTYKDGIYHNYLNLVNCS